MHEVAGEGPDEWNASKDGVENLRPGVLLVDGKIRNLVSGIEDFVVGAPQRFHPFPAD
jgi:hypothetical protein